MKKILLLLLVLAIFVSACGGRATDDGTIYSIACYGGTAKVLQIERGKRGTWWGDGYVYVTDLSDGTEYLVQGATCVFEELRNE